MKNLIYKELSLSTNKFFYLLPILLSCLFFIPQWVFLLIFMYFLWISVPQIYSGFLASKDQAFTLLLPVTRRNVAMAKVYSLIILELYNILLAVIFGLAHNLIYGQTSFFFDVNPFFYGVALLIYAIFNIIFLPMYFRTGYKFGKPVIIAIAVTSIIAVGLEILVGFSGVLANFLENPDIGYQLIMLFSCIVIFVILNYITLMLSAKHYENAV